MAVSKVRAGRSVADPDSSEHRPGVAQWGATNPRYTCALGNRLGGRRIRVLRGMSAVRDSQRAKVYDAEQLVRTVFDRAGEFGRRTVEVHGSRLTLPVERKFASVESVQEYCDRVLALNWVAAEWERAAAPIRVRARAGTVAAHYESGRGVLAVPVHGNSSRRSGGPWALRELVILHEITHHLEPQPDAVAAHGPEFCGRYVDLVEGVLGPEAGLLLRTTLYDSGVSLARARLVGEAFSRRRGVGFTGRLTHGADGPTPPMPG